MANGIDFDEIKEKIDNGKATRNILLQQLDQCNQELEKLDKELDYILQATTIVQKVATDTQKNLEYRISELVTLSMESIFDDKYSMCLDFDIKRGKSEAFISIKDEKGNKFEPLFSLGGGVVDIVSFGLRLSLWSLSRSKLRNTIILDEPFRFLSKNLHYKAGKLLKELSLKLGLQFIIVTHEKALIENADKVFEIIKENDRSILK